MKLFRIAILLIFLATFNVANSQSNWEVGARMGQYFAADVTVPLSAAPRLHGAVYFNRHLAVGTYFDWMFDVQAADLPPGLKVYPGVGPEIYFGPKTHLGVAGNFGIEYSFEFPLTVGIDWRPGFMVTDNFDFYARNIGILARFRFGEGVKFVKSN